YTFFQLLIRNVVLAFIFILTFSVLSSVLLASFLVDKDVQHLQSMELLTQQFSLTENNEQDAKALASTLLKTFNFNKLMVLNNTDKTLFTYQNKLIGLTIPLTTPSSKKVSFNGFNISYQLDYSQESSLVINLLLFAFILACVLGLFSAAISNKRHKAIFQVINQQIKSDLALINYTNLLNNDTAKLETDVLEIPELKQGIADIKLLMAKQLKNTASLEQKAYIDNLTKLDNRRRFVQFYENKIVQDSPVKFGVLIIIRCSELQTINKIHGFNEGDTYITQVSDIIKKSILLYPDGQLFKLNSSDFACILPNVKLLEAEKLTKDLTSRFNEYQQKNDLDSVAYSGLVYFDKSKPLGELLALADTGVSVAQTQSNNAWYSQKDTDILQKNSTNYGNQNWRQEIDYVLENQSVTLLLQPIQPAGRNNKVYGEVLARFLNSNDEMLPTASFIAMAEKLDKIIAIDKLIIDVTIKEINNKNLLDHSFGINISARSITDEHFIIWLERKLLREPHVAPRLIFEITEYGLQQNINTSKRFIDMLHRVGSRVTVERFGIG
ncbi:MAG: EAL domain-containing protein, partial [Colwellia sp.]